MFLGVSSVLVVDILTVLLFGVWLDFEEWACIVLACRLVKAVRWLLYLASSYCSGPHRERRRRIGDEMGMGIYTELPRWRSNSQLNWNLLALSASMLIGAAHNGGIIGSVT